MDDFFLLRLILTFTIGTTWIFLTIYSGARFGSKIGGFIGGLPSTALLSFFFIGYTQSPAAAAEATTVFPLAIGISGLFLVVFAWFSKHGFLTGMAIGLGAWFLLSLGIVILRPVNFSFNTILYAMIMVSSFYLLEKRLRIKSIGTRKKEQGLGTMILRSLFGGLIILFTVIIAKVGGPMLGGIFAAFPAMFIATLTVTYKTQGIEFSRAITKPLLVTGMITVAVYAISLRYLYVPAGLFPGTFLSILIASVSAWLTFNYVLPKLT
jgi:uncharacterized membrane protein (GlpM family)